MYKLDEAESSNLCHTNADDAMLQKVQKTTMGLADVISPPCSVFDFLTHTQAEAACLQRRSPFDRAKHLCGWQQSSVYEGSAAPPYQCVWLKPQFEFKTLIEISIVVNFIANPIYYVTGYIVGEILLAPTHEVVNQQTEAMQERRRSVQHFMAAADVSSAVAQEESKKRYVRTFSTLHTVDETLFQSQNAVRRNMKMNRLLGRRKNDESNENASSREKTNQDFDCAEELFEDLQSHACCGMSHRVRDRSRFLEQWNIKDANARAALTKELEDAKKCSAEWISTLKTAPQATVGVRLLQLFVQDLIGRSTRQASIFVNQLGVQQISEKHVVTCGVKCVAFTGLCCLNFFFVFMCMLYGRSKGLQWQKGWLITSCVNLMVDVTINQVTVAVLVYYLIPNTIFDTTKVVKATINHAVARLGKQVKGQAMSSSLEDVSAFSATNYLFVSTRVAKAFPDSVESAVILACRSQVMAEEQSERWTKTHRAKRSRVWASPFAAMGLVASYFILSLGSQSLSVQELIVYALNPALFGAALRIGSVVSSRPYIAFPVGTAIVFGCAVAGYYFKKTTDRRSLSLQVEGFVRKRVGGLRCGVSTGQVAPLVGDIGVETQRGVRLGQVVPLVGDIGVETQKDINGIAADLAGSAGEIDLSSHSTIEARPMVANLGGARTDSEKQMGTAEDETRTNFKQGNVIESEEDWIDASSDSDGADFIFNIDHFSDVDEVVYEHLGLSPRQPLEPPLLQSLQSEVNVPDSDIDECRRNEGNSDNRCAPEDMKSFVSDDSNLAIGGRKMTRRIDRESNMDCRGRGNRGGSVIDGGAGGRMGGRGRSGSVGVGVGHRGCYGGGRGRSGNGGIGVGIGVGVGVSHRGGYDGGHGRSGNGGVGVGVGVGVGHRVGYGGGRGRSCSGGVDAGAGVGHRGGYGGGRGRSCSGGVDVDAGAGAGAGVGAGVSHRGGNRGGRGRRGIGSGGCVGIGFEARGHGDGVGRSHNRDGGGGSACGIDGVGGRQGPGARRDDIVPHTGADCRCVSATVAEFAAEPWMLGSSRPKHTTKRTTDCNSALQLTVGRSAYGDEMVEAFAHTMVFAENDSSGSDPSIECEAYVEIIQKSWADGFVVQEPAAKFLDNHSDGSVESYVEIFQEEDWP